MKGKITLLPTQTLAAVEKQSKGQNNTHSIARIFMKVKSFILNNK
jgi:hypothetical protein